MSDSRKRFEAWYTEKYNAWMMDSSGKLNEPTRFDIWQATEQSRQEEIDALNSAHTKHAEFLSAGWDAANAENSALKQRIVDAENWNPVAHHNGFGDVIFGELFNEESGVWRALFDHPPIPPDVAELQQKLAASEADVKILSKHVGVLCRCLDDTANERGGWAWEEVMGDAQEALTTVRARKEG